MIDDDKPKSERLQEEADKTAADSQASSDKSAKLQEAADDAKTAEDSEAAAKEGDK